MTQTAPRTLVAPQPSFGPLEQLQLTGRLQDVWRAQVDQITELAICYHSSDGDDEASGETREVARRLADFRVSLAEVEDALKRLDAGSYGRCEACSGLIEIDELVAWPARRQCASCESR